MNREDQIQSCVNAFEQKQHEFKLFMDGVSQWFATHPVLRQGDCPVVHSVKSRLKNSEHLKEKIIRKSNGGADITGSNLFEAVTDLAGVRVLHLYQDQFSVIHQQIREKVEDMRDWHLPEAPKAYTWDPESKVFFESLGIDVAVRESFYTSVHYLIKPRKDSPICCELQVRTLFEEIWGEVDHALNYPKTSPDLACREQLLVLAKLVGAGSRLVDSIFRTSARQESESNGA